MVEYNITGGGLLVAPCDTSQGWGSLIQRTAPTPIAIRVAMSLRREANVVIEVILEVYELLGWDNARTGPIAELGGPGKADHRFDMGSGRFVPAAVGEGRR